MRALIIAFAVACLLIGVAHADKQAAEKYFQAGSKAYAAQNFAAAAANFDEAFKELAMPEIAFSGAQAYRRLYRVDPKPGHVKRAVELYRIYLDKVKTGGRVGDASTTSARWSASSRIGQSGKVASTHQRTRLRVNISSPIEDGQQLLAIGETGSAARRQGHARESDQPVRTDRVEPGVHLTVSADGYFPSKKQRAVKAPLASVDLPNPPRSPSRPKAARRSSSTVDPPPAPRSISPPASTLQCSRRPPPFGREVAVARATAVDAPLEKTGRQRRAWVLGGAAGFTVLSAITGLVRRRR
jgi:peptidoglycan hydrolase-like protein with peptidoglycan-binding domain